MHTCGDTTGLEPLSKEFFLESHPNFLILIFGSLTLTAVLLNLGIVSGTSSILTLTSLGSMASIRINVFADPDDLRTLFFEYVVVEDFRTGECSDGATHLFGGDGLTELRNLLCFNSAKERQKHL